MRCGSACTIWVTTHAGQPLRCTALHCTHLGGLHAAGLEAQQRAAARGLLGVQRRAGALLEAGVVDLLDQRVAREVARERAAVLRRALHAQRHGLDAAQRQPAVEGREARALGVLVEVDALREVRALDGEDAERHVAVAADELGAARHADVGAEVERALEHGRHDAVVHARDRAGRARHGRDGRDVADLHARVGGRLDDDELGLAGDDGAARGPAHRRAGSKSGPGGGVWSPRHTHLNAHSPRGRTAMACCLGCVTKGMQLRS